MTFSQTTVDALKRDLAACKDRFETVFNASPSMIAISTRETGLHYAVNDVWLKTMGFHRDEVVGKAVRELAVWPSPEDRARYIRAFEDQGSLRNYSHELITRSGERRCFLTSCDEIIYDGEPRLLMVFHDITEQKRAEDSLRRANEDLERQVAKRTEQLQRQIEATERAKSDLEDSEQRLMDANSMLKVVLDTIPVRIFWKDLDLNLLGCNVLLAMDAGYKNPRQMIGKSDYEMGWRDQADLYRADDMEVIKSGKSKLGYEEPQTTPDGREIWLRTSKSPLRNLEGEVIGVLGMYEDITEHKQNEKELQRAKLEAERANLAKSQFLSSMSHELRTPLNAILGFAQLLEHDPGHPLLPEQKESVEHIKTGGEHLLDLINEILELARIEAGHLELDIQSTPALDVIDEVVPMAQTMAEKYGLSLRVVEPPKDCPDILVDAMRLKQILLNLLSNAMKYNVEGGTVTVACVPTGGDLVLKITDTGMGISPEGLKELFQPFARLGHENSEIEGTGIGLTITKELVEHMDGEIGVESVLGQGSTFWVKFPFAQNGAQNGAQDGAQKDTAPTQTERRNLVEVKHRGTVLYVEDNTANLLLMESIFEQFPNLRLVTLKTAEEGLQMLAQEHPELILLDIALPGMSGLEMLKTIRKDPANTVPVIAVSAHAMADSIQAGLDAGFDAYLTKPFDIDKLVDQLERFLGQDAVEG